MCAKGVDLGHTCIHCGKPLLSCWDDGPSISWHASEQDAEACMEARGQTGLADDEDDDNPDPISDDDFWAERDGEPF